MKQLEKIAKEGAKFDHIVIVVLNTDWHVRYCRYGIYYLRGGRRMVMVKLVTVGSLACATNRDFDSSW